MIIPWHEHKHRAKDWSEELECRSVYASIFISFWMVTVMPMIAYLMLLPDLIVLEKFYKNY
jgi:hypothetical protein